MTSVNFFPLPGPVLGLEIEGAEYNTMSGELEITYENTGNALEYVKSQILVYVDGSYAGTVGDEEPFSVGREEKVGIGYPIDVESGDITVNITSYYGSSKKSTEYGIRVIMDAGRVEFTDESAVEITDFTEDTETMVAELIQLRQELRKAKQFQEADMVRSRLEGVGIVLKDTPSGTVWERKR